MNEPEKKHVDAEEAHERMIKTDENQGEGLPPSGGKMQSRVKSDFLQSSSDVICVNGG